VDPDRGNRSAFNRLMRLQGFELEETRLDQAGTQQSSYKGRLLNYRRAAMARA
jgi:hypothetical protein